MISYLISTIRNFDVTEKCINSIESLSEHDHEIIICAPQRILDTYPSPKKPYIKYVVDNKENGSTYGFNLGSKHCKGDWILVGVDDNIISIDIKKLIEILNSPNIKNAKYQVYNLGGKWYDTIYRNHSNFGIQDAYWDLKWIRNCDTSTLNFKYPVVSFPLVSKKTIEEKFNGYLFNEHLVHHYVDHWLGIFVYINDPTHNFNIYSDDSCWAQHWNGYNNCIHTYDYKDGELYVKLLTHILQNDKNCQYNVLPL
jgi:hypothetical protein